MDHRNSREAERSSCRSEGKLSDSSLRSGKQKYQSDSAEDQAHARGSQWTGDHNQGPFSDGQQSSVYFFSEDDENTSDLSHSPSASSPLRTRRPRNAYSSPSHQPAKTASQRPPARPRPPRQQRGATRSQSLSKDTPSKEVGPVTKRMLSARLLKMNELKNALSELRLHAEELQRENRLLRQMQRRQDKALYRYHDTESEISQLLSRHNNETHVLRERLRRSQESQRSAERSLRETDAKLQLCRSQLHKLQQLADDQNLGEREELSRKMLQTQVRLQESERRVKELERHMELNSGSFQRQLSNEKKMTHTAQKEGKALQEEVERLCAKLKEKERDLDALNIYANRRPKASVRRELENSVRSKDSSAASSKAVQTKCTPSPDFPSPPPAVACDTPREDCFPLQDPKLRPREAEERTSREKERESDLTSDQTKVKEKETERKIKLWESNQRPECSTSQIKALTTSLDPGEEDDNGVSASLKQEEELKAVKEQIRPVVLESEAEERKKEQLLAKMLEIDMQTQTQPTLLSDTSQNGHSSSKLSELKYQSDASSFSNPLEHRNGVGSRRQAGVRIQRPAEDFTPTFGGYAPSFGKPAPRGVSAARYSNQEGEVDLDDSVKDKKSDLMQQLFGVASPASDATFGQLEILSLSSAGPRTGRRRETDTHTGPNTLHSSENRLAIKAIKPFEGDVEEITL